MDAIFKSEHSKNEKKLCVGIQIKTTWWYLPLVLIIFRYFTKRFLRVCFCFPLRALLNVNENQTH